MEAVTNRQHKIAPEKLQSLPQEYYEHGEVAYFMESAWPFIKGFVHGRLTDDPDEAGDFILHFYEVVPEILDRYRERQDRPFSGYLAHCLRHSYWNFITERRRKSVRESAVPEMAGAAAISSLDVRSLRSTRGGSSIDRLCHSLRKLPLAMRLPLKLYHGFRLETEEMREIIRLTDDPVRAAGFVADHQDRVNNHLESERRRRIRVSYLENLIARRPASKRRKTWRRWQERIAARSIEGGLYSLQELADLLGHSKSTIARRMERARKIIKGDATWQLQEAT